MLKKASKKTIADQFLILALLLYIISVMHLELNHLFYYLKAFSEAAIVGGIADWFAVTALFRHPIGLKIPHTAIIPNSKSKIGKNLSKFIRENFLSEDYVKDNLKKLDLKNKLYLIFKSKKITTIDKLTQYSLLKIDTVNYKFLEEFLKNTINKKINEIDLNKLIFQLIKIMENEKYHRILFINILKSLNHWLSNDQNEKIANETIKNAVKKNSTGENTFSGTIKSFFIGEPKLHHYLTQFIHSVEYDPMQTVLNKIDIIINDMYTEIEKNQEFKNKILELKNKILDNVSVESILNDMLLELKLFIVTDLGKENSIIKLKISDIYDSFLEELNSNNKFENFINHQIEVKIPLIMSNNIDLIDNYFIKYIDNLNTDEISTIIEEKVGEDLQFIRINGTIIGGIIGLSLFSITELIFFFI